MSIDEEMERCREWIEAALDCGGNTHDFYDVLENVKAGLMQFWPAEDACAVTEIVSYPKKKVLHIFLAGGNMETIISMNDSAEQFAMLNECSGMSIAGRKGWKKVLQDKGYKEAFTTLGKDLI